MNSNPICNIEDKRADGRMFMSSQHNPEFWIWSDGDDDPHWSYARLAEYDFTKNVRTRILQTNVRLAI